MTIATFKEIQKGYKGSVLNASDTLANLVDGLKKQYRFSCDNFGNTSQQAGNFDKMLCAVQTAIETLETVESVEIAE